MPGLKCVSNDMQWQSERRIQSYLNQDRLRFNTIGVGPTEIKVEEVQVGRPKAAKLKLESLSVIVKEVVVQWAGEVTRLMRVDLSEQACKHHTIISTRLPGPSIRRAIRNMESDRGRIWDYVNLYFLHSE